MAWQKAAALSELSEGGVIVPANGFGFVQIICAFPQQSTTFPARTVC